MTKIFNFALKIKGDGRESGTSEVLQPCHPPKKSGLCTCRQYGKTFLEHPSQRYSAIVMTRLVCSHSK